jgi:hypothetical protein
VKTSCLCLDTRTARVIRTPRRLDRHCTRRLLSPCGSASSGVTAIKPTLDSHKTLSTDGVDPTSEILFTQFQPRTLISHTTTATVRAEETKHFRGKLVGSRPAPSSPRALDFRNLAVSHFDLDPPVAIGRHPSCDSTIALGTLLTGSFRPQYQLHSSSDIICH